MKSQLFSTLLLAPLLAVSAFGAEYRVEAIKGGEPPEQLSEAVAAQIGTEGFRVIRGADTTLCEVWLRKQIPAKADFKPSAQLLYPFQEGDLLGVIRYVRRGSEFRDQPLSRGVYTLRYALQPVDGNHVGTSETRDFLLLVRAEDDESAEPMEIDQLNELACDAAESTHPAMLCLQKAQEDAGDLPAVRHQEDTDWWIVQFTAQTVAGDKAQQLPVALVVVGIADE